MLSHKRALLPAAVLTLVLGGLGLVTMHNALTARRSDGQSAPSEPSTEAGPPDWSDSAAHPTTAPSSTPTRDEAPVTVVTPAGLEQELSEVLGSDGSFSVAGLDLTTGRSISAGTGSGMTEASLVKLDILETALYRSQLGESFDADAAEEMMDNSDNVAADQVFSEVGGNPALAAYNAQLGLSATALEPNGIWGLSTTSAADQLSLLRALVSTASPLTAASRQ